MSAVTDPEEPSKKSEMKFSKCASCCCVRLCKAVASHPFCPSWNKTSRALAMVILGLTLWGGTYSMVGHVAGPDGQMFKIGALGVLAQLAGWLVSVVGLPPLLGMLLMGILLRNIEFVVFSGSFLEVAATLRQIALVIILTRAGLGLDASALKRLGGMVTRLAIIPGLVEGIFTTVTAYFLLGLPWIWGILLGAVLAAVSPAVVIPCLFSLQDRGYGKSSGIPTLVVAAASFDDIIAISVFSVVLSIIFSMSNLTSQILQAPLGAIFGLLGGILYGLCLRYIPQENDSRVTMFRTMLLAGGGLFFMFGSVALGYDGAGPLGVIVSAFVACNGWKSKGFKGNDAVADNFSVLWSVFQPILFGLIGTEINLFVLEPQTVGLGIACLLICLFARILAAVAVAAGGTLTFKEKIFVSFAWFPKAAVQAAIGPVALDKAREIGNEEYTTYASKVLMLAVLAILITAPLGASLIMFLGPRLLTKEQSANIETPEVTVTAESDERPRSEAYVNETYQ